MRRTYLILALSLASITALLLVASVLAGGVPSTPVYGYGYWKKPPLHSAATLVGARDAFRIDNIKIGPVANTQDFGQPIGAYDP